MKAVDGWNLPALTLAVGLAAAAGSAALLAPAAAAQTMVGITARCSLLLFALAFTASAAARLWPGRWTAWQRRNRRYLGLSFAVSHGLHGLAVVTFAVLAPELFAARVTPASLALGGLAYGFIAAMAVTSFPGPAAALGPRRWRLLHVVGSYYIWLIFLASYGGRAAKDPTYLPAALLVIALLAVRLAPAWRRRMAG